VFPFAPHHPRRALIAACLGLVFTSLAAGQATAAGSASIRNGSAPARAQEAESLEQRVAALEVMAAGLNAHVADVLRRDGEIAALDREIGARAAELEAVLGEVQRRLAATPLPSVGDDPWWVQLRGVGPTLESFGFGAQAARTSQNAVALKAAQERLIEAYVATVRPGRGRGARRTQRRGAR
jgi:hypothetical protein